MLADTALEPVQLGPASFRLQVRAPSPVPATRPAVIAGPAELDEVLITASKRTQSLLDLPLPITVVSGSALEQSTPLAGSRTALDFDPATSSTNLGPGRNHHFIRGVADSPFSGASQATVSMQFDEARLNYSAPDPDLRLLDVERVEILKGPQGPLYGTGALGGVFHIVPRRPDLNETSLRATAFLGDTRHGTITPGGSAVFNLPLATGSTGLRAVVYGANESGWIDNTGGREDANSTSLKGVRAALRSQGDSGWNLDVQGVMQFAGTRDSQYVTQKNSLHRSGILPEPSDNDLYLGTAILRLPLAGSDLLLSSSYVSHEVNGVRDASGAASAFGVLAPARYADVRTYNLFSNELRLSSKDDANLSWLLGAAHLTAHSHNAGRLDPAPPSGADVLNLSQVTTELALFGEASVRLQNRLKLTAGLRMARVADEDERGTGMPELEAGVAYTATPSLSLDWHSTDHRRFVFMRVAQAVRPGGLNPEGSASGDRRFRPDELSNLDLGLRLQLPDAALTLQSSLFATRWEHVQSDYLLANGLAGTRNVGKAHSYGLETQLHRDLGHRYAMELGAVLQRARLDTADPSLARDNSRLPVVPDVRASIALLRDVQWAGWTAHLQSRLDYVGATHLSFTPDLDRRSPDYLLLGVALHLTRGSHALRISIANLLDSRADTFAFGNPFSIRGAPQYTPQHPRTVSLQMEHSW